MLAKSPLEKSKRKLKEDLQFSEFCILASGLLRYVVQLALIPFYLFLEEKSLSIY